MGACCEPVNDKNGAVSVGEVPGRYTGEKTNQNDDCSILVSSYSNELNYNVKYKECPNKVNLIKTFNNSKKK